MAPPRRRRGSTRATTRASTRASARAATRGRGRGAGSLARYSGWDYGHRARGDGAPGSRGLAGGASRALQATVDRLVEEALRNRPREPVADGHFPGMSQGVGVGGGGGGLVCLATAVLYPRLSRAEGWRPPGCGHVQSVACLSPMGT